jgi:hypothetical protein
MKALQTPETSEGNMNKIIEYRIVSDSDTNKVEEEVNALIKEGFQPLGSIAVSYAPSEEKFCAFQAVIKYAEAAVTS